VRERERGRGKTDEEKRTETNLSSSDNYCGGRNRIHLAFVCLFNFVVSYYCISEHYLSSCFYLNHTMFRRLNSVLFFRWKLLRWAQPIELVPSPETQNVFIYHRHKLLEQCLN
jgi:hypothetical protein